MIDCQIAFLIGYLLDWLKISDPYLLFSELIDLIHNQDIFVWFS